MTRAGVQGPAKSVANRCADCEAHEPRDGRKKPQHQAYALHPRRLWVEVQEKRYDENPKRSEQLPNAVIRMTQHRLDITHVGTPV